MIRLLQLLFLGHVHKWKTIKVAPYTLWQDQVGSGPISERGTLYTLQCEHCGTVRGKKV